MSHNILKAIFADSIYYSVIAERVHEDDLDYDLPQNNNSIYINMPVRSCWFDDYMTDETGYSIGDDRPDWDIEFHLTFTPIFNAYCGSWSSVDNSPPTPVCDNTPSLKDDAIDPDKLPPYLLHYSQARKALSPARAQIASTWQQIDVDGKPSSIALPTPVLHGVYAPIATAPNRTNGE